MELAYSSAQTLPEAHDIFMPLRQSLRSKLTPAFWTQKSRAQARRLIDGNMERVFV